MKIIAFITDLAPIRKILDHLSLWTEKEKPYRDPPQLTQDSQEVVHEPFDDGWPGFDEIAIDLN